MNNNDFTSFFTPVVPYFKNDHIYFFAWEIDYYKFVILNYLNCTFTFEKNLIPPIKRDMQGAWYEDKFYCIYKLPYKNHKLFKYGFGYFHIETKKFTPIQLPQNIEPKWMDS